MWDAYWQTASTNPLDWVIIVFGVGLILAHFFGLGARWYAKWVWFVQDLHAYRTFLLLLTELLPVLGLLGTVLSLMYTFKSFQVAAQGEAPDLSHMVRTFAPAMSTTVSGLMMIVPNLLLNGIMWLVSPTVEAGESQS